MLGRAPRRYLSGQAREQNGKSGYAVWRRGGDSNPRYQFTQYDGLANRCLQPLSHLSMPGMQSKICQRVAANQGKSSGVGMMIRPGRAFAVVAEAFFSQFSRP